MRLRLAALVAVVVAASTGVPGSTAAVKSHSTTFTGYGFETCSAPSLQSMQAWTASPYRAIGVYIGGTNRACGDGNLSSVWLSAVQSLGFNVMPLYVGLQAPCVSQNGVTKISAATAGAQGASAANDAVLRAGGFGLLAGSPIYFDMEGYSTTNPSCSATVQAFLGSWISGLHAQGYVAGVYGSSSSTIRDVAAMPSLPDDIWIANWNGKASVFGDPAVSDSLWTNHQRIHQYKGGHKETWGGVTINIDNDYVDGAVVGPSVAQPPPPPPPAAGSVGSGDSQATASWPQGAFTATAAVNLTPVDPAATPSIAGGYAVQLAVDDASTTPPTPVTAFTLPVTVHIAPQPAGITPSASLDSGATWKTLPPLVNGSLPTGTQAGFAREADGSIDILTLVPGMFGLLPDRTPPGQPVNVAASFANGGLVLTWGPAPDASQIVQYRVLLDGQPLLTKSGSARRAVARAFHPAGQSVYRVVAVDAAGNVGKPSRAFVVVPSSRPLGLPKPLPHWAWDLFTWQHTHAGTRPAAAPKQTPGWYWRWATWRAQPFRLKR